MAKNGIPRFANNEASVYAKYHINIDGAKMKKFLSGNIKGIFLMIAYDWK